MLRKKKNTYQRSLPRKSARPVSESFRRNNVVVSRKERELKQYQASVTQRQHDRTKRLKQKRMVIKVVIAIVCVGIIALLFHLKIDSVTIAVNQGSEVPQENLSSYQEKITKFVSDNTSLHQVWLIDESRVSAAIQSEYPEVESVSYANSPLVSGDVTVKLIFRTPQFVWQDANKQQQYVDSHGVLFASNWSRGVDVSNLVHIEDQSGVVLEAGSSVLTESLVQFVGQLPKEVAQVFPEGVVEKVIIPESIREVRFKVSGVPYEIKFSVTRPLGEQIAELKILQEYFQGSNSVPAQYVDLRVPHKAFYK